MRPMWWVGTLGMLLQSDGGGWFRFSVPRPQYYVRPPLSFPYKSFDKIFAILWPKPAITFTIRHVCLYHSRYAA